MSFPVHFYNLAKKPNSTRLPSGSPVSYNCILKGQNSILAPTIQIVLPITQAPTWNYCYIPLYNRYYFVEDWDWTENRIWYASLTVDVLATYRTTIGNTSLYVTRSATEYNPDIIDNFYPTRANFQQGFLFKALTDIWDAIHETLTLVDFKLGTYVVGLVSNTDTTDPSGHVMLGGVTYYLMNWAEIQQLVRNLILIQSTVSISGVSSDAAKFLTDPFQYIYSVVWLPVSLDRFYKSTSKRSVSYGPFTFDNTQYGQTPFQCYTVNEYEYCSGISFSFELPKHPQITDRGRFLKAAPYTSYTLFVPPFGQIVLDPAKLYDTVTLSCSIRLDPVTGNGYLKISNQSGMIDYRIAKVGVDIPMAQITTDIIGTVGNAAGGFIGTVGNALAGNIGGAVMSAFNGITSAVSSAMPSVDKMGGAGDFNALSFEAPYLYYSFEILVDEDLYDNGRPLMQNWRPSAIPGYLVVENGNIEISGTLREAEMVRNYLENGFYYE